MNQNQASPLEHTNGVEKFLFNSLERAGAADRKRAERER